MNKGHLLISTFIFAIESDSFAGNHLLENDLDFHWQENDFQSQMNPYSFLENHFPADEYMFTS